jgi:hypothetical protein
VLSLVASIAVFGNAFTWLHGVGSAIVFGGAIVFSFVGQKPKPKAD